ncbi:hypothetical protein GIB67_005643, partial [Kingdonia uniflora]
KHDDFLKSGKLSVGKGINYKIPSEEEFIPWVKQQLKIDENGNDFKDIVGGIICFAMRVSFAGLMLRGIWMIKLTTSGWNKNWMRTCWSPESDTRDPSFQPKIYAFSISDVPSELGPNVVTGFKYSFPDPGVGRFGESQHNRVSRRVIGFQVLSPNFFWLFDDPPEVLGHQGLVMVHNCTDALTPILVLNTIVRCMAHHNPFNNLQSTGDDSNTADTGNNSSSNPSSKKKRGLARGNNPGDVKASPVPKFVPREDWVKFADYCNSEKFMFYLTNFRLKSKRNKENRAKLIALCTLGRTSMPITRHKLAEERGVTNEEIGRVKVYIPAHTKKDKTIQCPDVIVSISPLTLKYS